MCAFGLMNTIGTFQAYLVPQQLAGYIEADIGWIFGLYLFMAYCCGVQTGPIFDAGPDTHSHHYLDTYIVLKCRPPDAVWTLNNYSAISRPLGVHAGLMQVALPHKESSFWLEYVMSTTIELTPICMGQTVATSDTLVIVAQSSASAPRSLEGRPSNPIQAIDNVGIYYTRALKRFQKCLSVCWSKLKNLYEAIRQKCAMRNMRALGRLCLSKCWTKLQKNLISLGQTYTLPTWLGVMMTLIIGGVSLRYAYMSIELAEWTARKDYYEICQSLNVSASTLSPECQTALQSPLSSPPFVNFRRRGFFAGRRNTLQYEIRSHGFSASLEVPSGHIPLGLAHLLFYPYVALVCSLAWLLKIRRRLRRVLTFCQCVWRATSISRTNPRSLLNESAPDICEHAVSYSSSVTTQSSSGLRNRKNRNPYATIWNATRTGDVEEIERQLQSGVDVNTYSAPHGTPLSVAAYHGRAEALELLLSRHAEVNGCHRGYRENALHLAAERGHETIVQSLLEHGADMNAKVCGVSAVHIAAMQGHWSVVRTLLKFGADDDLGEEVPMSISQIASSFLMDPMTKHSTGSTNSYYNPDEVRVITSLVFECLSSFQQPSSMWVGYCAIEAQGGQYFRLPYGPVIDSWAKDSNHLTFLKFDSADPDDLHTIKSIQYAKLLGDSLNYYKPYTNTGNDLNCLDIIRFTFCLRLMSAFLPEGFLPEGSIVSGVHYDEAKHDLVDGQKAVSHLRQLLACFFSDSIHLVIDGEEHILEL